jgi:hypothetical protein
MGIALLGGACMAIRALDPADLYVEHIADNLCRLLHLPTPRIISGRNHGGERNRWVDLFGLRGDVTVLEAVQRLHRRTTRIRLYPTAVVVFEAIRSCSLRVRKDSKGGQTQMLASETEKRALAISEPLTGSLNRFALLSCKPTNSNPQ